MTQTAPIEPKTEYHLKGIELLKSLINTPDAASTTWTNFQFIINMQSRLEIEQKTITVIVSIEIMSEGQKVLLGSISVSNIYQIVNFEEAIKLNAQYQYEIPPHLLEMLSSTSFSTTRGVMYATFKGTFLNNALLPLIDSKKFKQ